MATGLECFYNNCIQPYVCRAITCLTEWKVPHQQIREKVTELALPQIKLVAWLALVMSPAPSVMVASAALVFVFEPWIIKRFNVLSSQLAPEEGRPQTRLEAFASTFFNHRTPEITEIQIKLNTNPDNQVLRSRLADLQNEDNKLSANQQALFFGASLIVVHLLSYPFTIILGGLVAIIFGGLVGDHLYRAALRNDTTEEGAEPVYGHETLIQTCTIRPEKSSEPEDSPPIEWTFAHAWTLLSEHVNPLLRPITQSCESNDIPLVPLVRKTYALAVPTVKCIACIAILTLASPAVTLPYATVLVASIWLIFDSLGGPLIKPLPTGETYLEDCVHFFDNEKITLNREHAENARIIKSLKTRHESNLKTIQNFEDKNSDSQGSVSEHVLCTKKIIDDYKTQNTQIDSAEKAYTARNEYIEKQNPCAPTPIERQAAAFAIAYLAAKLIGHYWIYYGLVAVAGGVLLGNHIYHWAKREEGWEIIEDR